jgi:hypothetical protein
MARDEPEIPYVDYTSIHFPSDKLSIGDLRRMRPELFAPEGPPAGDFGNDPLSAAMRQDSQRMARERGIRFDNSEEPDTLLTMLRELPGEESTIRDLRRLQANRIDVEGWPDDFNVNFRETDELLDMLFTERVLALMAHQEVIGQPGNLFPHVFPSDCGSYKETLESHYIEFGLASGPQQAKEMIREFIKEAKDQAPPHPGHPRR